MRKLTFGSAKLSILNSQFSIWEVIVGLSHRDSRSITLQKLLRHGVIVGLLPRFSWSIWWFLWLIFGVNYTKRLTLNALLIHTLSFVICAHGLSRSEIRANFEGPKITFVTFLT